jgi:hypothetical protein
MEVKELRLGNYVENDIGNVITVDSDTLPFIVTKWIKCHHPILLTEEWLLRFKEVKKIVFDSEETGYGVEYHIKINENLIINIQDDMSFCLESISDDCKYVSLDNDLLDTVHFLQNIYNVLTKGKELTIK